MNKLMAISIMLLLIGCSNGVSASPDTGKYAPKLNSHPHYFVTVQGHIDQQLKKQVQLSIIANYYSTNPACNYVIDDDDNQSYRFLEDKFRTHVDAQGNYQQSVAIDYYQPGYCDWKLNYIVYQIQSDNESKDKYGIAYFSEQGIVPKSLTATTNWLCIKDKGCQIQSGTPLQIDLDKSGYLALNQSYQVIINFKANGFSKNFKQFCLTDKLCLAY